MKAYHSLVVFIIILACAALSSMHSYRSAEREMVADMNQALRQTLAEKHDEAITLDTIQAYRSYLRIAALCLPSPISDCHFRFLLWPCCGHFSPLVTSNVSTKACKSMEI